MGTLRRRIEIVSRVHEARAVVEDDFHHFRVWVRHDGLQVTAIGGEAPRHPWSICPMAADRLVELVGMPLSPCSSAVGDRADQRLQCTHMFDLAGLAIAAAARSLPRRRYDVTVPDRVDGRAEPALWRDGAPLLAWGLEGTDIRGPEPFAGQSLRAGFTDWAGRVLPLDLAEAALVLRRAVFVSGGRGVNLDAMERPGRATGGCITLQPDRVDLARRMVGSTLDFTDRPEALALADEDWLAFAE